MSSIRIVLSNASKPFRKRKTFIPIVLRMCDNVLIVLFFSWIKLWNLYCWFIVISFDDVVRRRRCSCCSVAGFCCFTLVFFLVWLEREEELLS